MEKSPRLRHLPDGRVYIATQTELDVYGLLQ